MFSAALYARVQPTLAQFAHEIRGCRRAIRHSLRPLCPEGGKFLAKPRVHRAARRRESQAFES